MNEPALVKPARLDATAVRECIRSHYGANGEQYSVLFEVRNGTAWRANRSVDAVVMGLWPSLGMHLTGIEIKVSRGDWMREYRDPGKASEVFDYFDKWCLVAPADVAKVEELPEPWGWMVPENGKLRTIKQPVLNPNVKPPSRHFLAAIMRNQGRVGDAPLNRAVHAALAEQSRKHEGELERRVLERLGDMRKDAEAWVKVRDALKTKPDDFIYQPEVIDALRVIMKSGVARSYSGLTNLIQVTKRLQDDLSKIAGDLNVPTSFEETKRRDRKASR